MDDEFAHEGGEGDFGWFAFGNEALVEVLEDGIGAAANQGAYVEGFSGNGASGAAAAFVAQGSAVTVEGGDSCESGDGTDSFGADQDFALLEHGLVLAGGVLDEFVDLLDLGIEEAEVFFEHVAQYFVLDVAGAVGLCGALGFEVFAAGDQFGQEHLLRAGLWRGLTR